MDAGSPSRQTERARKHATLTDVAALAGVSRSTASNVARGSDVVAARTRRRVQAAIEQLGYRPNALARQLLRGRATNIGIIARDLRNPFIAEMASFVEREVARFGFAAMFCATEGDSDREDQAVALMLENRVSGLVFLSFLNRPETVGARIDGHVPAVFIAADEPWADSVTVDERRGGELVGRHLIDLGHRRLAFVGPMQYDRADSRRLEGFLRVAAEVGLQPSVIGWDPPDGEVTVDGSGRNGGGCSPARAGSPGCSLPTTLPRSTCSTWPTRSAFESRRISRSSVSMTSPWRACGAISLTTVHQRREELVQARRRNAPRPHRRADRR